jgi:hypothetical protein
VESIRLKEGHEELLEIAEAAMEELKKQNAGLRRLFGNRGLSLIIRHFHNSRHPCRHCERSEAIQQDKDAFRLNHLDCRVGFADSQ